MTPFETYAMFQALKLHFNTTYDFKKYHGKTRAKETTFETRRDKYHYVKLSKHRDPKLMAIANLFENTSVWVGDLQESRYKERKSVWDALEYNFRSDMSRYDSLDDAFVVKDSYAQLYSDFRAKLVTAETLIICNMTCNIFDYWDSVVDDTILWPIDRERLKNLSSFIDVDRNKYLEIVKEV